MSIDLNVTFDIVIANSVLQSLAIGVLWEAADDRRLRYAGKPLLG